MLETNKVYQMDVLRFLDKLDDNSIDLAIIDPPYNMKQGYWDTFGSEKEYFDFMYKWIDKLLPKMKKSGSIYLFNNQYNSALIVNHLKDKNVFFKNWITWYKKDGFCSTKKKYINNQEVILFYTMNEKKYLFNSDEVRVPYLSTDRMKSAIKTGIPKNGKRWFPNSNGKLCPDVWEFASERLVNKKNGITMKQKHPTPKPEKMIERMILASSKEGDLVLDLFSGTGTTSYVSKIHGRKYIGCELDPEYIEIINKRLTEE